MKARIADFLDGRTKTLEQALSDCVNGADEICILVAHARRSGVKLLKNIVKSVPVKIIVGVDFNLTEPEALKELKKPPFKCRVYRTRIAEGEATFHPKVYIVKKNEQAIIIVGSSNLTEGGFRRNIEHSVVLVGRIDTDLIVRKILDAFETYWNLAVPVTDEFIRAYESEYRFRMQHMRRLRRKPSENVIQDIQKKRQEIVSKKEKKGITLNDVIICHTKEHDINNKYDELVGIPGSPKSRSVKPYGWVTKGTRIFIYYKQTPACPNSGIYVVVEATDEPYYDDTVIPEWADAFPEEVYPHRIPTRPLYRCRYCVTLKDLKQLGITSLISGKPIGIPHLRRTLVPISRSDGDKILKELLKKNRGHC